MQKLMRWHDVRAHKAVHFGERTRVYGTEAKEVHYF